MLEQPFLLVIRISFQHSISFTMDGELFHVYIVFCNWKTLFFISSPTSRIRQCLCARPCRAAGLPGLSRSVSRNSKPAGTPAQGHF